MAVKLPVTVAVLFFACTVAFSRTPLDLGDDVVALPELPKSEQKATTVLLLPSQNPETAAKHPVDVKTEDKTDPGSSTTESIETVVPLTVVTFRPINRQFFPRRPLLPVGPGHRCRHGHKMMRPRFYGNDMIVSGGKDHGLGLDDKATRGVGRQIPVKRARISFFDDVANGEVREWRYKKRHHNHLQAKGEEGARKHEHKWELLKGIRKFLKQNF
ncbi:hypothetical protein SADUNF_Sadunf01G0072000 [Salix dunnii]|uniref:Uncharacterized protein n=1 Tax=Salix dunnii TaxID=1413687 RepID=A0A835NA46_9ROSI|nr:hypothetical protein SADUNF_Sadunf01G0072000 [Salix dunnii]